MFHSDILHSLSLSAVCHLMPRIELQRSPIISPFLVQIQVSVMEQESIVVTHAKKKKDSALLFNGVEYAVTLYCYKPALQTLQLIFFRLYRLTAF